MARKKIPYYVERAMLRLSEESAFEMCRELEKMMPEVCFRVSVRLHNCAEIRRGKIASALNERDRAAAAPEERTR